MVSSGNRRAVSAAALGQRAPDQRGGCLDQPGSPGGRIARPGVVSAINSLSCRVALQRSGARCPTSLEVSTPVPHRR